MKPSTWHLASLLGISLAMPATAETIYSNLQDVAIPTDFTGVTLTLAGGGTINPFFGGVGVANNSLFQPVRTGTGNLDPLRNLSVGSVIDVNQFYSTGSGGSQTHLGNTFTAGQEGYIGFKLNDTNYGWMRVVFTGNTAGAVIKDWAYENSGANIVVGRVNQSTPSAGTQLFTLSPGTGESFSLGSSITNTGGNINSVVKTGSGTAILTQSNTYTGTTTVSGGTLLVNGSQSAATGAVTVNAGATLGGSGVLGGSVSVAGSLGTVPAVTESIAMGNLSLLAGSTLNYKAQDTTGSGADLISIGGDFTLDGLVTLSLSKIGSSSWSLNDRLTLLSYTGVWNNGLFTYDGNAVADDSIIAFDGQQWLFDYNATAADKGDNFAGEAFGNHVTMTVVPEPAASLLGSLGVLILLNRRVRPTSAAC